MSTTASEVEAKKLINEGYELICKAMELDVNNFAVHKWMAVLLDKKSESIGLKERIKQLGNVKNHMLVSYFLLLFKIAISKRFFY